jgi:molybdenum cofactor guanylyltransferase
LIQPILQQGVAVLILAGGRARRMGGGDKPLLSLAGHPVLRYQLARLHARDCVFAINAHGSSTRFADFGLPVLPDDGVDHPGPLAGVLAGLLWAEGAGCHHLLTVPGDCPFLPRDLLARLWDARDEGRMAVCAKSGGQVHFTTALWPVTARGLIADALAAGERRVGHVLGMIGYHQVEWPVEPYDAFFNINTPDDLREAERMIHQYPALALPPDY